MTRREIDPSSHIATFDAKLPLPEIEGWLNKKRFSLGYRPKGWRAMTLQEALEEGVPNELAWRYGELCDICLSLSAQRPRGHLRTKGVPRAATGPDFKKLLIGSKGIYGRIQEATLRIIPLPEERREVSLSWRKKGGGHPFLKEIAASGIRPASIQWKGGRPLSLFLEGEQEVVAGEFEALKRIVKKWGGRAR